MYRPIWLSITKDQSGLASIRSAVEIITELFSADRSHLMGDEFGELVSWSSERPNTPQMKAVLDHSGKCFGEMSTLGQKQTKHSLIMMSTLPPKADINR